MSQNAQYNCEKKNDSLCLRYFCWTMILFKVGVDAGIEIQSHYMIVQRNYNVTVSGNKYDIYLVLEYMC